MLNIIKDELQSIKVKAETKRCNMPSMEEIRIKQENLIDKLRCKKVKEVKKEDEQPVVKEEPVVKTRVRRDIIEIDRRKNKENDDRIKEVKKEDEQPVVKEEVKKDEPVVKEEVKKDEPVVKEEVKKDEQPERDDIDYLINYAHQIEDELIMDASIEDLLSDPTLYEDYDIEIVYDDGYDYINNEFYNNVPVDGETNNEEIVNNNVNYNDEQKAEEINSTLQWIEGIMNSTGNVNDLFNQCKKIDDENNE